MLPSVTDVPHLQQIALGLTGYICVFPRLSQDFMMAVVDHVDSRLPPS